MTLRCFTDGNDTVIAEDETDATAVWCDLMGEKVEDYADTIAWKEVPMDKVLEIDWNDGECGVVERTVAEWIEYTGRGHLCSADY